MHTLLVITAGSVLLGAFVMFGILWGNTATAGIEAAVTAFIPLWLAASITNMWIGVARAGYAAHEELPILAVVFAVPTAIAVFAAWRS